MTKDKLVLKFTWKFSGWVKYFVRPDGTVYSISDEGYERSTSALELDEKIIRNHLFGWSYSMKFNRKNYMLVKH